MDPPPPPPYDHPHHRRGHPGHHYPDPHHHFPGGSGGGAAPVRSRYEYDSYEPLPAQHHHHLLADHHHHNPRVHHLPSDHHHHPRVHHQQLPPPPPLPQHHHDAPHYAPALPAPPEPYSTPPYHNPAPHHHYRGHQRYGDDDFRPVASHHHHHPQQHQQQLLPWEEAEDERYRYVPAHQVRLSPSGSRKRQRCAIHDGGDLESTSSSGPPPRHLRQQTLPNYTPVDSFVDRTTTLPSYHEGFSVHSESKGSSKMQMPLQMTLPGSPHAMVAGHPRRTPQKAAPRRVSVWQRIEENPASPRKLPKEVHISPCKSNNAGSASKELSSVISMDSKGKSAGSNDGDSNTGSMKNTGNMNVKVLASVLVKPSPESKEKEGAVKKVTEKPDKVQKNVVGSTSKILGSTAFPGAGVKKVRKIVIKKIVRKIGGKDKQISSSIVSEKRDSIDANANACEKEEGEIITSSFEKDAVSAHNLVSTSGTAGAGNGVDAQKEENSNLTNTSKRNAASAIESTKILDPTSVSGSEHPGKEEDRTDPGDNNAASAITSTEVLGTSGSEHPGKEDRSSMDSGVRNAAFVFENDNSQEEGEIPSLSGEMNVAVASNSVRISDGCEYSSMEDSKVPKDASENNATDMDGITVDHDTTEVSGSENARKEDGEILIDTNEEGVLLVNNFIVGPSTTEVSVCDREGVQRKEGMIPIGSGETIIASLGETVGTPRATEVGASQDAREEEGSMLSHPSEQDFVSVSSWRTLNTVEVSVSKNIQEKEGRMPMESSEANTSATYHAKASNAMEFTVNEDTQKKESQMPIESCQTNTSEVTHHLESSNTAEVIMSKFVGTEVGKSLVGSNERHAGTTDNSVNTSEFDIAGGAEDSHVEDLLSNRGALNETDAPLEVEDTDFFNLPSSRNIESTSVPLLDDDPMEDSTSDIILNNGVGRNATTQAAELLLLHRAHLPPENDFTLVHSRESSSASGNSEQSVPTALTLGSNIYFSNSGSEGQSDENHELVEGQQGIDVAIVTEFDSFGKRKGVAGDDLISAGVKNWLTLPPPVNSIAMPGQLLNNNSTIRKDKLGLDQSVDDETSVSQDHDVTQDMDQHGSVDAFFTQDHSIRQCCSDLPRSDLLAPKEISGDVENHSGIVLSGLCSISSINDLGRHGYQMADIPVDNTIKSVLPALESTDMMDAEPVSSQAYVDPDHTYKSNTEDPVADSSTKKDLLSSWIEAIVSEAKKEDQPCKSILPSISSPDKVLAPKEDSRRAVLDSVVNSVVKSPQMNFTSSMLPKVAPEQVNLPSSSREPPRLSQNARHKTWYRGNMASSTSSLHASQPSGLPPKQPLRNGKTQNSYIRKGNALIRNPATGNHPHSSSLDSSLDTQNKLNKPVMRRSMNFVRKVDSNDLVAHSNISVERPKTPPLLLHAKSISSTTNLSEQLSQTLQKQHSPETGNADSIGQLNSGVDNPSIKSAQKSELSDASKVVYVRPKSNQLVAAQRQHPGDSINSSMDKALSLQPPTTSDFYFKKRKNQIILNSSPPDGQNTKDMAPAEGLNADESKGQVIASTNNSITGVKDKQHKALQTTNSMGSFSHVWTLSGQQPQRKGFVGTSHVMAFPRILPWKRKIYYKNFRSTHTSLLNTSSLRIVRKLLQTKKRGTIYTVSTDGFSLRKSAVLSVGGSSLKWSRSLEKRSQKVNKEATVAVADVERKRGEKRKRQSLSDEGRNDRYSVSVAGNQIRNNNQASSHLRNSSTSDEYVRVSKGNQLVRNPKKVICMLASEKVRWSLHTVRSRLAKKQQYCKFFTRFGECKKPGGKCRYIHDRAKVTICTKFLKGLCSNTSCKLTHKVLPERMQDCSYFLRGLCTNTACPYRHVKVNLNAPVCEDFLKGYCADGDECHKKHSYACPVFEATGECPQQSRCKLHHPKKKTKSKRSRSDILQNSSWGRYFDTSIGHDSETRKISSDEEERQKLQHILSGGDLADFISLDADADDGVAVVDSSDDIQLMELDSGDLSAQADNLDALIKPLRIMRTARV